MTDQAHKLRSLVESVESCDELSGGELPLVVISGARAGVGATTVALNLAAVLADRENRVLLIDGTQHFTDSIDPSGSRSEVKHSLADVLANKCAIEDAIVDGPAGVAMVLAGRRGAKREPNFRREASTAGDYSRRAQDALQAELQSLVGRFDLMVVDAGRGLTPWSRRLWQWARLNVLVATPEDAAVLDAYAMLKESAADSVGLPVRLLVNRADSDVDAVNTHWRLDNACRRFLSRSIAAVPSLPRHFASELAGANRPPRLWEVPNTPFGHAVLWLGRSISELTGIETVRAEEAGINVPGGMEHAPFRRAS